MSRKLERRINNLVSTLDPTAAPPADARRRASELANLRRQIESDQTNAKILREHPEIKQIGEVTDRYPEGSPEYEAAIRAIIKILCGGQDALDYT